MYVKAAPTAGRNLWARLQLRHPNYVNRYRLEPRIDTIRVAMHALSIKQLTKTYSNGLLALKGIDFDVEPGDFYALLGPNGAGKTTAIGIICTVRSEPRHM